MCGGDSRAPSILGPGVPDLRHRHVTSAQMIDSQATLVHEADYRLQIGGDR